MITWSSKPLGAVVALTFLAACEEGQGGSFLQDLSSLTPPHVPLSQADMAFGAVTLKAPDGFCIDKGSLKQQFALMARCDKFGVPSAAGTAPVGVITVSFIDMAETPSVPSPSDTAAALKLREVSDTQETDTSVIFRADGPVSIPGMSPQHWRGTAQVGSQLMSLALFGPEGGSAIQDEGRSILSEVISNTEVGS